MARILIIDDDEILSALLKLTLEVEGYEVACAEDGDTGFARLQRERFDLVILDLVMPRMDGIKFLRVLGDSDVARVPVLIVSSAASGPPTEQHRALGVVDIARKPVEPAELVRRVARALGQEG